MALRCLLLIDRYLIREVSLPFVVVSAALITVFVTFSLTRYLTDAVDGLIPPMAITQLAALKGVIALEVLLPLALYVAVLIGLGRLYADQEVTALRASGLGEGSLLRPLLRLTLLLAVCVGLLSWLVRPWAYAQIYQIEAKAEANSELDQIRAGKFYVGTGVDRTVFVDEIDANRTGLRGIFVRTRSAGDVEVVSAPRGDLTPYFTPTAHRLTLHDARIVRRSGDRANLLGEFQRFDMQLQLDTQITPEFKVKALPGRMLRATSAGSSSDQPLAAAELQWRLAAPLITCLLTVLALPLSRSKPRSSRFGRVLLAVVLYAIYYNSIGIARGQVEQGSFDSLLWVVLAPVPLLGLWLLALRWPQWRSCST